MNIEDGLDKLLRGQYAEALAAFEKCVLSPQVDKLRQLARMLAAQSAYAAELSEMKLAAKAPQAAAPHLGGLQELHLKLKRLSRQLLMASTGYSSPSIDYLGDLSEGMNFIVGQALQRGREAEHERNHDAETGLLNRKPFIRGIYDILRSRPSQVGVLFCCVLDNLKYINDTHGYDCGDIYIGRVVDVLRNCLGSRPGPPSGASSTQPGSCLLSRLGGNEFAVYAHGFTSEKEAMAFAKDSLQILHNSRVMLPGEEVKIRASCGVAIYPHDATASDVLMNYASHAMFEVKNLNRGTVMRFSREIYRTKANLLRRQEKLGELIENKLIDYAFQPVVNLRNGEVLGYEALMRPRLSDFSGPLEVLALAEDQSKLQQLEKITFEVIFDWIFKNSARLAGKKIFFNTISVKYLDIAELRRIHPQYESISKNMVFEILENAAVESTLLQRVSELRRTLSALIAIDDFGCGHSNALRLISISPDILKIDRFFISNIQAAPAAKKELLANILSYCRAKGILTLAEGVETFEELSGIMELGFDYAQGFYLGRPAFDLVELKPHFKEEIATLRAKYCPPEKQ